MGPISGVVCKGYFARGMQERGQIMTIFCLARYGHKPDIMRFAAALLNEGAVMA